jgi:hypothetical protein
MRTLDEIKQQLKQLDEITLLELLGVSSEELIDRFEDVIYDNVDKFDRELEQWFETEEVEDDHYSGNEG